MSSVEALHRRCGVYTKPEVVRRILDDVGWHDKADLTHARLLEPAAGDGAFVVEAARRLIAAFLRRRVEVSFNTLRDRITAFELLRREAKCARSRVIEVLRAAGVHHRTAQACARSWILSADFLLSEIAAQSFTHAVGNPPYVRWSKIPSRLKKRYDAFLPPELTGGDLFVPFLDLSLEALRINGTCGFLCSDRWRFMAFAERFRQKWLGRLDVRSQRAIHADKAFLGGVCSYPTILIASKTLLNDRKPPTAPRLPGRTLEELGCVVKVGPALGHTAAYVLAADERDVEATLLRSWIDTAEISERTVKWTGRRVIAMHTRDGQLIDPERYPRLMARLLRFRKELKKRCIVKNGAPWFRTIDRVRASDWTRPKLLIPELAKLPRVAIDRSGAIPSHGVYAIFAPDDDVESLYGRLCNGRLSKALDGVSPRVNSGYIRCYKRFLLQIRI